MNIARRLSPEEFEEIRRAWYTAMILEGIGMLKGFRLGDIFKIKEGKVSRDEGATLAKLPVNKRIARKKSKKIRIVRRKEQDSGG